MRVNFRPQNDYFITILINISLIIISLGLYLPWAVTNIRRMIWSNTSLDGHRFHYLGHAKEILKGYLVLIGLYLTSQLFSLLAEKSMDILLLKIVFSFLGSTTFLCIFYKAQLGSFKYQVHRTAYKGIRFQTDLPSVKAQYLLFMKWAFFTVITFGLTYAYFYYRIEIMKYNSLKYGNEKFRYQLSFSEYLGRLFRHGLVAGVWILVATFTVMNLYKTEKTWAIVLGVTAVIGLLIIFSHALYSLFLMKIFWLRSDNIYMYTDLKFNQFLKTNAVNLIILLSTFFVGYPIVMARNIALFANSVTVNGLELVQVSGQAAEESASLDDLAAHSWDLDVLDAF